MFRPMRANSRPDLGGLLLGAVAITLVSMAVGLAANHLSPNRAPVLVRAAGNQLPQPAGVQTLSLMEAERMYEAGSALFIDARPADWYARKGHIPGALSLPADNFARHYLDQADRVEAAPLVVVYCEGVDCGDALATLEDLKQASYRGQVRLFAGGWSEWTAAKYPIHKGEAP